jgi:hypothetical protein
MEATVLSVGKSVLDATLSYTRSAVAEEVALQLRIQNDHDFVRDELQMMQSFLMAADEEPEDDNRVSNTWYKQVGSVAYDVEDCLHDFSVHLDRSSCWPLVRKLRERRRIAGRMKELRAKVEDVSKRNMRYQLFRDPASRPAATAAEQRSRTEAAIFGINEARHANKADLVHLVNNGSEKLGVIAVWGTSGDLGQTSVIRAAYDHAHVRSRFPCRAWVRVTDPFSPREFVQSLVDQFTSDVGVHVLLETEKELATEFSRYVEDNRYLIVLNNVSTIEQWDRIKICFPNKMKGSRIIVSTTQVEVANLCPGQEIQVSELSQLSADQTLYAFYDKVTFIPTYILLNHKITIYRSSCLLFAHIYFCLKDLCTYIY